MKLQKYSILVILNLKRFICLQDISAILAQLNPLPTDQGFPSGSKFYVFQEVIDQNDGAIKVDEYYDMGKHIK